MPTGIPQALAHAPSDESGPLRDVLPGVLVHLAPGVLELVAALSVASSLGRRAVSLAAGDLDHEVVSVEAEVNPRVRPAFPAVEDLWRRPWQS